MLKKERYNFEKACTIMCNSWLLAFMQGSNPLKVLAHLDASDEEEMTVVEY